MHIDLDDVAIRNYLLGLLPEAEAEVLEEAYLGDPQVFERVRGVEDDLLDDYAGGRLARTTGGCSSASTWRRHRCVTAWSRRALFTARPPGTRAVTRPGRVAPAPGGRGRRDARGRRRVAMGAIAA